MMKIKLLISDFDGVFTDNCVYISESGEESVKCNRSDGIGIKRLMSTGVDFIVCSSETVALAEIRANKIGFKCFCSVADKLNFVKQYLFEKRISSSECAFLGNDVNDLSVLKYVHYSIAVSDAFPEVLSAANFLLKSAGGQAAVREACDLVISINSAPKD